MPEYLVKRTSKKSVDYMKIPKGTRRPIKKAIKSYWKKRGYKPVRAKSYKKAITKVTGIKLGKIKKKR